MATTPRMKLGFVSPGGRWASHYDEFLELVPPELEVQIEPLGLYQQSLDQLRGQLDAHLARSAELVRERGWSGIALMGAPMEVHNPGFIQRAREALDVPVTTALASGAAALRAFSATKVLLLTPFDDRLRGMLRDHLAGEGIEAVLPGSAFETINAAASKTPDEVYALARDTLSEAPGAQAIYFQGAPFNPLKVLDKLEADLGVPIVASNLAMLWHVASLCGHTSSVAAGGGRLLREWPAVVPA